MPSTFLKSEALTRNGTVRKHDCKFWLKDLWKPRVASNHDVEINTCGLGTSYLASEVPLKKLGNFTLLGIDHPSVDIRLRYIMR